LICSSSAAWHFGSGTFKERIVYSHAGEDQRPIYMWTTPSGKKMLIACIDHPSYRFFKIEQAKRVINDLGVHAALEPRLYEHR
jgi:hypothetical protein